MPIAKYSPDNPWEREQPVLGEHRFGRRIQVEANAAGTELVGGARFTNEFDQDPEAVPRVPREYRWGGICEFLPQPWANDAKERIGGLFPVQALCLSCNRWRSPKPMRGIYALAWASDHDATFVGHELVLVFNGLVIVRNPYHPLLGTQISGEQHRAFIAQRKAELYHWQHARVVDSGYAERAEKR